MRAAHALRQLGSGVSPKVEGRLSSWERRSGGISPHTQVAEIQRARLLAAAVSAIEQFGYAEVTVAQITARARVSRRTFYEMFANGEACLVAVFENVLERIDAEIVQASLDGLPWRERVRRGLWRILAFFDREPVLARVCVVQSLRGSETILEYRANILTRLAATIDEGRHEDTRNSHAPSLTAEGLVGAAHAIVYERLLKRSREPLAELHGQLMGMIVLPYLGSGVARRELTRSAPRAPTMSEEVRGLEALAEHDPLKDIPMRLTYRTARVLECIARSPGISNRVVGESAGISDQGQASKLLARLERLGLIANTGEGHSKGEPNAWRLTSTGSQVVGSIRAYAPDYEEAAL